MILTHIDGASVNTIEIEKWDLEHLKEYNSDEELKPTAGCTFEGEDASGYAFKQTDLHDVVIIFDFDGAAQFFIGPRDSFQH
jgi:hypothetical protein